MAPDTIIQLEEISKTFGHSEASQGRLLALDKVSLTLRRKDFVVLGGSNGSGKSLLMSIMAGIVRPSSGKIIRKASLGLVFQNPDTQILGETPWEDVSVGPKNQGLPKKETQARTQAALELTGLSQKAHCPARSLSGGEKRRLAIAGVLAMEREVIVFDEPFANLDYPAIQQTVALLQQLKGQGKTIMVLTHELEKCLALATKLMVLHQGQLVFDGSPEEGLRQPLESWAIRNPLQHYKGLEDLAWW